MVNKWLRPDPDYDYPGETEFLGFTDLGLRPDSERNKQIAELQQAIYLSNLDDLLKEDIDTFMNSKEEFHKYISSFGIEIPDHIKFVL